MLLTKKIGLTCRFVLENFIRGSVVFVFLLESTLSFRYITQQVFKHRGTHRHTDEGATTCQVNEKKISFPVLE